MNCPYITIWISHTHACPHSGNAHTHVVDHVCNKPEQEIMMDGSLVVNRARRGLCDRSVHIGRVKEVARIHSHSGTLEYS